MIETIIPGRIRSIGSMTVKRVLPYVKRRSVGPFVFMDDFGPLETVSDQSLDVLPHPHIGLSTVTYLFEGNMTHRDSIGTVQLIRPGDVNLMTAGSGIVHSERVSDSGNKKGAMLSGLQTWIALPEEHEETEPAFGHYGSDQLPVVDVEGVSVKTILGSFYDSLSPAKTFGSPFYAECKASTGSVLEMPRDYEELAIYGVSGVISVEGKEFEPGNLIVIERDSVVEVRANSESTFMVLGGAALGTPRFMYWNFVSSSRDRIEEAKEDWKNRRFDPIPNETGRIPLPKI